LFMGSINVSAGTSAFFDLTLRMPPRYPTPRWRGWEKAVKFLSRAAFHLKEIHDY